MSGGAFSPGRTENETIFLPVLSYILSCVREASALVVTGVLGEDVAMASLSQVGVITRDGEDGMRLSRVLKEFPYRSTLGSEKGDSVFGD